VSLSYALITPARDEKANLRRLAESVAKQTLPPQRWLIVDNGSSDGTVELASALEREHSWIRFLQVPAAARLDRGAPPVHSFVTGVESLRTEAEPVPDVVVKLDADVSFEPDFFERLLGRFEEEPRLGIASGLCLEKGATGWEPTYSTRSHARGATRAYRWDCFEAVSPLVPNLAWDTVDELRARIGGWQVATIPEAPFLHHRKVGTRDGAFANWFRYGTTSHYLGYRPSYLLVRSIYRMIREPAAVGLLAGYVSAAVMRRSTYPDKPVRDLLRDEQRLRHLRVRGFEALGRLNRTV
jgi:glycosyltransferase involved in cell wall biosynthesis